MCMELVKIGGYKVQTSLWLDRDVKMLIMSEGINLSKFVNDQVLLCLSVDNEQEILGKIKDHEISIKALRNRLENLRTVKTTEGAEENVQIQALDELRASFSVRGKEEFSREMNIGWISSPKNVGRCRLLKKTPETVLNELEAWYDGIQKDHN